VKTCGQREERKVKLGFGVTSCAVVEMDLPCGAAELNIRGFYCVCQILNFVGLNFY
jgi:hypothetical protein